MKHNYEWPMELPRIREHLGNLWGLERSLTRAELGRALGLGAQSGEYLGRMEKTGKIFTGPAETAVRMMMAGCVPHTAEGIVKPSYPRGAVKE